MQNANNNNLVKDIMANSGLEINDPHFSNIVISKIMQRKKQRFVVRYIISCSLIIAIVTASILLLINYWQSSNTNVTARMDAFSKTFFPNNAAVKSMAWQSIYLFLPLGILLLLKKIIDLKVTR